MSNQSVVSKVQANLDELFQGSVASGNAYIKFQLDADTQALLSMERVQESLIVEAEQITTLPGMHESTIGMLNSRDRVFCVFDLVHLLTPSARFTAPRQYQIIVLQTGGEKPIQIGLAVMNLQGIIRLSAAQIQSSTENVNPSLRGFVSGVVEQEVTVPILEFERIVQALRAA